MAGARVDPVNRRVTLRPGTLWLEAVEAAPAAGRAVLHGSSPDVGVVGYSLGGGMGWYARLLGLQAADEGTTSTRLLQLPPLPELPPFLRGRQLVVLDGAVRTDDARAAALLAPLRALGVAALCCRSWARSPPWWCVLTRGPQAPEMRLTSTGAPRRDES